MQLYVDYNSKLFWHAVVFLYFKFIINFEVAPKGLISEYQCDEKKVCCGR